MHSQSYFKHILRVLSGLVILIGLMGPDLALAQTVTPPPPPLAERRQLAMLAMQNHPSGAEPSLQPNAAQVVLNPTNRLVFQSYRDGNWEIYTSADDGSNLVRLTNNKAIDEQPRFNHGANRIVFVSNRDGDYEIFTMNPDGSGLFQVTHNTTDDLYPALSPDGTKILFMGYRNKTYLIYLINADGTGEKRAVSDSPYFQAYPAWSPDGTAFVYINQSLSLMRSNLDGTQNYYIANGGQYPADLNYSPDGSQVAYDSDNNQDGWQELMVVAPYYASSPSQIGHAPPNCDLWAGSWSPDSRYLAYTVICYVYVQGTWYWSDAHLEAWDSQNKDAAPVPLAPGNTEWNPDLGSTDTAAPVTSITVPPISPSPITLHWGATDPGGSGVRYYDVEYKTTDTLGNYISFTLRNHTTDTSASIDGFGGKAYYFRVRAADNAGNLEAWPADYQAAATVEALPPQTTVKPLPAYVHGGVRVSWGGADPGGSGIRYYNEFYRRGQGDYWYQWMTNTTDTSAMFSGYDGETYYFASTATDYAWNGEPLPASTLGLPQVTFYAWGMDGMVHDNSGAPVANAQVTVTPQPIAPMVSGADGSYNGYSMSHWSEYSAEWAKDGYGAPPQTAFLTNDGAQVDIALPPADSVVRDGSFEVGSLPPENWQTGGALPAGLTAQNYHTGRAALSLGQMEWGDLEQLGAFQGQQNGISSAYPRLAYDSQGTAYAIWTSVIAGNTLPSVLYASKPAGGACSVPLDLSGPYAYNGLPAIAIDSQDTIYAAWNGSGLAYRIKPKGGAWSEPSALSNDSFGNLTLAADTAGALHLVYRNSTGIMYTVRSAGGQWSDPVMIESNGENPAMALDAAGTVHVLWYESLTASFGYAIFYSYKPKNGVWSAAARISSSGDLPDVSTDPDLAIDAAGGLHGVWSTNDGIEYAEKLPGAAWSAPVMIAGPGGSAKIFTNQGKVGVVYGRQTITPFSSGILYTERSDGVHWSQSIRITPLASLGQFLNLAVGPDGRAGLVYFQTGTATPSGNVTDLKIMYLEQKPGGAAGDAWATQSITIPDTLSHPTLAFYDQLWRASAADGAGLSVTLLTDAGEVSLLSSQADTRGWAFQTFDLSQWSGQTVTLKFNVHQAGGGLPTWAMIDDVSLGSTYPDVWVSGTGASGRPGDTVTFNIACGNRGGAPAAGVGLAVTLPAGLTFVSAEPAPVDPAAAVLTWDLGDLAAKSDACSISLTAGIVSTVTIPHTLAADAQVTTVSTEIEVGNNTVHPEVDVPYYRVFVPSVNK